MFTSSFSRLICLTVLASLVAAGCGGAPAEGPPGAGAGGRGGGPGVPVEMVTLAPVPVEDASEFVGTVKSRRSTVVQSQVEGFLTRIAVTSGARVTPGTVLFEIDSTSQQAAFAVNADPVLTEGFGATGKNHFYLDSNNDTIHVNSTQPATASDPTIRQ